MDNEIASSEFLALDSAGNERRVRVALSLPKQAPGGEWVCSIDGGGLVAAPQAGIVGADSLQAMCLSLALIRGQLEHFRLSGGRLLSEPERADLPLDSLFGFSMGIDASSDLYQDDYPSCVETYATLRLFADSIDPSEISAALNIEATRSSRKGEPISPGVHRPRPQHMWLLSTKGFVDSRDTRRHVDWLLDKLDPAASAFITLKRRGVVSVRARWAACSVDQRSTKSMNTAVCLSRNHSRTCGK